MPDEEELHEVINEVARGPKRVTVDGETVEQHSLTDLIKADEHVTGQTAARRGMGAVRFFKIVPPGTV